MWGICVHWLTGLYCFIHGGSCIENKDSIILQLCVVRKASPPNSQDQVGDRISTAFEEELCAHQELKF